MMRYCITVDEARKSSKSTWQRAVAASSLLSSPQLFRAQRLIRQNGQVQVAVWACIARGLSAKHIQRRQAGNGCLQLLKHACVVHCTHLVMPYRSCWLPQSSCMLRRCLLIASGGAAKNMYFLAPKKKKDLMP